MDIPCETSCRGAYSNQIRVGWDGRSYDRALFLSKYLANFASHSY